MVDQKMPNEAQKYSYGKKPWWYWLIIYLIVAGLVYLAVYYLFFAGGSIY